MRVQPLDSLHGAVGRAPEGAVAELIISWQALLAVVLGMAASSLPGYTIGTFIAPLSTEFGWTVTEITSWSAAWSAGCILAAPVVGSLADKLGARRVALTGLSLLGSALAMSSFSLKSLWLFYAGAFAIGVASAAVSSMTYGRIVTSRFNLGLGTALGLMSMGIGLSAVFGPRLLQWIIDAHGWRWGFRTLALFPLLILPWSFFSLSEVSSRGAASTPDYGGEGYTRFQATRIPAFWFLAAGSLLYGVCVAGVAINLIPYLTSEGMSRAHAAASVGIYGAATTVGRFAIGVVLDRIRIHVAILMCILFVSEGAAFLAIGLSGETFLPFALAVFGLAVGGDASCLAYCTAKIFGRRFYSSIFGLLGIVTLYLGTGIGPPLFSITRNTFGSYSVAFMIWAMLAFLAAPVFALVARTPFFVSQEK